jgi:lysozyme
MKRTAAWVSICTACVASFEGLRQNAYMDVVNVPTVCFGESRGVRMGDHYTVEECKAMLEGRLYEFSDELDRCVTAPLTDTRRAALVSFSYNVGTRTACRSSVVRRINAGDVQGGCDALLLYDKAGGVVFPGLTRRRQAERELCLS